MKSAATLIESYIREGRKLTVGTVVGLLTYAHTVLGKLHIYVSLFSFSHNEKNSEENN